MTRAEAKSFIERKIPSSCSEREEAITVIDCCQGYNKISTVVVKYEHGNGYVIIYVIIITINNDVVAIDLTDTEVKFSGGGHLSPQEL